MELNLKKLQDMGAFVGAPVKKSIKWKSRDAQGKEQEFEGDVYIRHNSCETFERDIANRQEGKGIVAGKIAANVCTKDGKPLVTQEQAETLCEELTAALVNAIWEVNSPKN